MKIAWIMTFFALAFVLCAAQPHGLESSHGDSKHDEQIAAAISTKDSIKSASEGKQGKNVTAEHEEEPAKVIVASAVSVRKDRVDYAFVGFSFLLVVVGGLQIALLWRIQGESRLSERAWIAFQLDKIDGLDEILALRDSPEKLREVMLRLITVNYSLTNCGKTPALIEAAGVMGRFARVAEIPDAPDYSWIEQIPLVLPPARPNDGSVPVPLLRDNIEKLSDRQFAIVVYGMVRYRDVLSDESHESRFCVLGRCPEHGKGILFQVDGPEAYNRYT